MQKKVSLPSFLEPLPPRLLITPQITYKLVDLIKVSAPSLLTHEFVRRHTLELRTALFEFQVEEGVRKWTYLLANAVSFGASRTSSTSAPTPPTDSSPK